MPAVTLVGGCWVTTKCVLFRVSTPIALVPPSVNQMLPSGPAVIPSGSDWCRGWVLGDGVGRRVDLPILPPGLGEPEVAVGAGRDADGPLAVGMGNSVMAWVVGLIIPICRSCTRNQRLPSGPAVIPTDAA